MGRERKKLEDLRQALKTAKAQKDEIWATLERLRGKIESTLEAGKYFPPSKSDGYKGYLVN